MNNEKILSFYQERMLEYPDYYSDDIIRIINNSKLLTINPIYLPGIAFNVRDGINILRESFSYLDKKYLDIFNYMISKNLIFIEKDIDQEPKALMSNYCKHYDICSENCPEYYEEDIEEKMEETTLRCDGFQDDFAIDMSTNSIENMILALSHEMGHCFEGYMSNKSLFSDSIAGETSSQLFSFLVYDYVKNNYPRIKLEQEEAINIDSLFDQNNETKSFVNFVTESDQSYIKRRHFFENMKNYEENTQYMYSYFLAYKLYSDYQKSKSLDKTNILLTTTTFNKDELLSELGINKRSIGTKQMIKEIKNRFN